jgi:rRNA maturation protein Rpf1
MLVRNWELKAKAKVVLKTYERGAQPLVSVVERRVMPEAIAFKFRLQLNLALMR